MCTSSCRVISCRVWRFTHEWRPWASDNNTTSGILTVSQQQPLQTSNLSGSSLFFSDTTFKNYIIDITSHSNIQEFIHNRFYNQTAVEIICLHDRTCTCTRALPTRGVGTRDEPCTTQHNTSLLHLCCTCACISKRESSTCVQLCKTGTSLWKHLCVRLVFWQKWVKFGQFCRFHQSVSLYQYSTVPYSTARCKT